MWWEQYDISLFNYLNKTCHSEILDIVMPIITECGGTKFIFAIAIVMLFFKIERIKFAGLLLLSGSTLVYHVVSYLKTLVARPRPFFILLDANIFFTTDGFSFPSSHAAMAFLAAVILAKCFFRWYIFYPIAIIVALSRVYVGVHYPTDVLAGACIGLILGGILVHAAKSIEVSVSREVQ